MRPQSIDEIVGQDHLLGPNKPIRRLIESKQMISLILYGNPGVGKTTLANCIVDAINKPYFKFNASTDNKQALREIIEHSALYDIIIIIDEIHRMKKDIQDYLLPFVEEGRVKINGITTVNPYHSVNPAFRSRTLIYKLNDIKSEDLHIVLNRAQKKYYPDVKVSRMSLAILANGNKDVRQALNMFEAAALAGNNNEEIIIEYAKILFNHQQLVLTKIVIYIMIF